jgi:hypothetical protein
MGKGNARAMESGVQDWPWFSNELSDAFLIPGLQSCGSLVDFVQKVHKTVSI